MCVIFCSENASFGRKCNAKSRIFANVRYIGVTKGDIFFILLVYGQMKYTYRIFCSMIGLSNFQDLIEQWGKGLLGGVCLRKFAWGRLPGEAILSWK